MTAAARLVERARDRTRLLDLGPEGWQEGLDRLLAAVASDLGDDPAAGRKLDDLAVARLVNRLRIEQWYAEHGDAASHRVEDPVVIVGLPRTATTALQYLLAVDPQFRYQRRWEVNDPVPPPDATTERRDPRRLAATDRVDVRHISSADGPIEDVVVLGLHFHNQELGLPLPSYTAWWRDADLTTTFGYHERVLRLLHSRRPPYRWLLKAPAFLFHIPAIAAQYPGARFLMTHRDPAVALPSTFSTVAGAQAHALPDVVVDSHRLAAQLVTHFAHGTRRTIAARALVGEQRFLDVAQRDVETDPLGTVERIYSFLDLQLTDGVRAAMTQWAADNRRGARGRHEYSAADFGCTPDGIRDAFSDYLDRFSELAMT